MYIYIYVYMHIYIHMYKNSYKCMQQKKNELLEKYKAEEESRKAFTFKQIVDSVQEKRKLQVRPSNRAVLTFRLCRLCLIDLIFFYVCIFTHVSVRVSRFHRNVIYGIHLYVTFI